MTSSKSIKFEDKLNAVNEYLKFKDKVQNVDIADKNAFNINNVNTHLQILKNKGQLLSVNSNKSETENVEEIGYYGTYSNGQHLFKTYIQVAPAPWAELPYYADGRKIKGQELTIHNNGCGTVCAATIMDALYPKSNYNPETVTRDIVETFGPISEPENKYMTLKYYLQRRDKL